LGCCTTRFHSE